MVRIWQLFELALVATYGLVKEFSNETTSDVSTTKVDCLLAREGSGGFGGDRVNRSLPGLHPFCDRSEAREGCCFCKLVSAVSQRFRGGRSSP